MIHDIGATARIKDGEKGFHILVGGGLGAVPHPAQELYDFIPEAELLPLSLAILRVFGEHGEKRKRARARLKFLVAKLGIDAFRDLVETERAKLTTDARWTEGLGGNSKISLSLNRATRGQSLRMLTRFIGFKPTFSNRRKMDTQRLRLRFCKGI